MRVNGGTDMQAAEIGGGGYGFTGTATATSATSLTATGTPFVVDAYKGQMVIAGSVYGVVISNTTSVLTVDQWYVPSSPGGAAGSTPSSTVVYTIVPGQAPAMFMALTTNATAPSATDTSLASELATAGSGLIRKIAAWAHTASASTYTMAATFTATATDQSTGSQAVAKGAMFNSIKASTGIMQFETLLNAVATLVVTGDQTTITQTVTM
jgi:hypothetical protein